MPVRILAKPVVVRMAPADTGGFGCRSPSVASLSGLGLKMAGSIMVELLLEDLSPVVLEPEIFRCFCCKLGAILVLRVTQLFRMWCHLKELKCGDKR